MSNLVCLSAICLWVLKAIFLPALPEPAETGSLPMGVRGASEVHDATNKERHVCERRRVGEAAVSCENAAGGLFPHPARACRVFLYTRSTSATLQA